MITLRAKCPNAKFFSGPYSPLFGLTKSTYSVRTQENACRQPQVGFSRKEEQNNEIVVCK